MGNRGELDLEEHGENLVDYTLYCLQCAKVQSSDCT